MKRQDFEAIYLEYRDDVFHFLLSLTGGDGDLSEELTQETFLQAWTALHRFRGDCSLRTWLYQISKNCWLKYLRRHRNAPVAMMTEILQNLCSHGQDSAPVSSSGRDSDFRNPEEILISRQQQELLGRTLLNLPKKQRDVVILRLYYDMPYEEIERVTGIRKDTARVLFQRGRTAIMNQLKEK